MEVYCAPARSTPGGSADLKAYASAADPSYQFICLLLAVFCRIGEYVVEELDL